MIDPLVFLSGCSDNCEINRSLVISPSGKRGWTKNENSEGRLNRCQSLTRAKPPAGQSHTRSKGTQGGTPHNGRNRSLGFFFQVVDTHTTLPTRHEDVTILKKKAHVQELRRTPHHYPQLCRRLQHRTAANPSWSQPDDTAQRSAFRRRCLQRSTRGKVSYPRTCPGHPSTRPP